MILTLIPEDKFIQIDGASFIEVEQDLSWVPSNVHAFHWYGDHGEIEFKDSSPNEIVTELGIFQQAVEDFNAEAERLRVLAELAEASRDYMAELRALRNYRLAECDWTQIPDAPLTVEKKQQWQQYRQALRDLPENTLEPKPLVLDPNHPNWPQFN